MSVPIDCLKLVQCYATAGNGGYDEYSLCIV